MKKRRKRAGEREIHFLSKIEKLIFTNESVARELVTDKVKRKSQHFVHVSYTDHPSFSTGNHCHFRLQERSEDISMGH